MNIKSLLKKVQLNTSTSRLFQKSQVHVVSPLYSPLQSHFQYCSLIIQVHVTPAEHQYCRLPTEFVSLRGFFQLGKMTAQKMCSLQGQPAVPNTAGLQILNNPTPRFTRRTYPKPAVPAGYPSAPTPCRPLPLTQISRTQISRAHHYLPFNISETMQDRYMVVTDH